MQQVARSLLEDAPAARAAAAAPPRRFDLAAAGGAPARDPAALLALLRGREEAALGALARAIAGAGGGKGAKEAAFDDNLDRVVALGWAYTERMCLQNMAGEAKRAGGGDPASGRALGALAALYGASCAERAGGALLAAGLIGPADADALRGAVNGLCRALATGGAAAPALKLVDAFGVPEHLLGAPIAGNWRTIGA